ncbi:MAG: hypothetical protein HGA93_05095 [Methanothrix sp.]|nr:hypothetical protein [Methanothrix sp.]
MKAGNWNRWEKYLPSAKVETRRGKMALCIKPFDQILPEEGVEERMGCAEPLWRPWERYLQLEKVDSSAHLLSESGSEVSERVKV